MKILFLDVDGVLNSYRNVYADGGFPFPKGGDMEKNPLHAEENLDRIAVGMVRRACDETGAKIVLHSTWRRHLDSVEAFAMRWKLPIIGATRVDIGKPESIRRYLFDMDGAINRYAILDDDDMGDREHQVFTSLDNGMSAGNFVALVELLK